MKHIIAAAIFAASFSAQAVQICSEVEIPGRGVVLACKNVPRGEPLPKPTGQQPSPAQQAQKPAAPVVQPVPVDVPETYFVEMGQSVQLRKEAFSGIAQAGALVPLMPSSIGKSTLNLGAANFGGQSAIGLTFAHRTQHFVLNAGAAFGSSGQRLVRVGAGMEF